MGHARTVVLIVSVLTAACGSTVDVAQDGTAAGGGAGPAAVGDDGGLSLGADGAGTATQTPDASGESANSGVDTPLSSGAGAADGSSATTTGQDRVSNRGGTQERARAGSGSASGSAPEDTGSAPGVTDTQIFLGFPIPEDVGEINESLGVAATTGDTRRYVEILLDDLNERGGLAGREVVPVFQTYDANDTQTESQRDQEACATWTEDNEVFAALVPSVSTPTLHQCLTNAGVATVADGPMTVLDDTDYQRYPGLSTANAPSLHRVAKLMADGLVEAGYYEPELPTGDLTIGLVRYDFPSHRRVTEEVLKPALARHGLEIAQEFEAHWPQSNDELSGSIAEISSAVLQFQSEGVDHVLLLDRNAGLIIFFTRAAENQGYRPQYGLTSLSAPQIAWATGAVPREQLRGSIGAGWYALGDSEADARPANEASQACLDLYQRNGVRFEDENAEGYALIYCNRVRLTEAAMRAAPEPVTLANFMHGVESLGTSYLPPGGLGSRFGPGRHDGAGAWAPLAFDDSCPCYRYVASPRPFGR